MSEQVLRGRFIALHFTEELDYLLAKDHTAFILLTVIAKRARWKKEASISGLTFGQAYLGDHSAYGMKRQAYRGAKQRLEKYGLATFKATSKGTIATLCNSVVYSISKGDSNHQRNHLETVNQPSGNHPATTNHTEHTEHTEHKTQSTPRKREVVTDEFLGVYQRFPKKQNRKGAFDKWKKLSDDDKHALGSYIDYMLANEWAGKETQYVPALAVVINQRRWLDDYQAQASQVDDHTEEKLSSDLKGILSQ